MNSQELIQLEETYGARNYNPRDVVVVKGKGVWVWDLDGRRYLDALSAYGAVNQGHCHPRIARTLNEQAQRLTLISRAFRNDQPGPLYRDLCELTGSRKAILMNSGVEAVETALKTARKWGYTVKGIPEDKAEIIVCDGNFHGRTLGVIGFSSHESHRENFGPFAPGFKSVPFGDLDALEEAIGPNTAGFLFEPIQAEGGINLPPEGYLSGVRELCSRRQVLMISDEIQAGLGRTGRLLSEQHYGVEADMVIIGKALSGGYYPVSAVLARGEELDVLRPGDHGSTFGGNPLASAVARTALQVLVEEKMADNARDMGEYFRREIAALNSSSITGVRGIGLLIGIEIDPSAGTAADFCDRLSDARVLANTVSKQTVRFAPPLVISDEEAGMAMESLKEAFS